MSFIEKMTAALDDPRCSRRCKAAWPDDFSLVARAADGHVFSVRFGNQWRRIKAFPGRGYCPAHVEALRAALRAAGQR